MTAKPGDHCGTKIGYCNTLGKAIPAYQQKVSLSIALSAIQPH
jgi:hypothetical protein